MKRRNRLLFAGLGALALTFALTGCGNGDGEAQGGQRDVLVVGQPGDPVSLDPHEVNDLNSISVTRQVFSILSP